MDTFDGGPRKDCEKCDKKLATAEVLAELDSARESATALFKESLRTLAAINRVEAILREAASKSSAPVLALVSLTSEEPFE